MKIGFGHFVLAVMIALAGARAAVAQETDATIIGAVLRFVDALEAGDAAALERAIFAETPAHERTRRTFIDLATAQKGLEKSAMARFGEEGKKFRCGFDLIVSAADRQTIANARLHWDDPNHIAHIERPGEMTPMSLRRSRKGEWQVVLEPIETETEDLEPNPLMPWPQPGMMRQQAMANIKAKRYADISNAFRETQARVDSGALTSAAAAQAELIAKLTAASANAAKARAAIPSRRNSQQQPQQQ